MSNDLSTSASDAAALEARRDMLGDFVAAVSQAVQAFAMPATFRDAERATRAITIGDRVLQRVAVLEEADAHAARPARAARRAFRDLADQVMARAQSLPLPKSFIESERAFRYALSADRMLCQLYLPPKPTRRLAGIAVQSDEAAMTADPGDDLDSWLHGIEDTLRDLTTQREAKPAPVSDSAAPPEQEPPAKTNTTPSPAAHVFPSRPRLSRNALLNGAAAFPP